MRKLARTPWDGCNYLSLGGTSPLALLQFLKDHPEIKQVYLCLDNDKAGLDGMERIEAAIQGDKELQGRALTVERKARAEKPSVLNQLEAAKSAPASKHEAKADKKKEKEIEL